MSYHFFPMAGKPSCPDCSTPEGVILEVGDTGFSVTSGFEHKPECPQLRCSHGVLWTGDCGTCDEISVEMFKEDEDR